MNYKVTPKLGKLLNEREITQVKLVEMCGGNITQATISRFDKNEKFIAAHLVLISKALGLTIEDLFEIEEEK
ncbi:helix-turn-helix transcriptional regulator [Neobacillus cucumis]|uniref:helix-turn-helix domain-containing protein n=1 Tax=Neobacillus cucumis TaxID=1740721 RepID=UPI002E24B4E4|nr:helix-turn-helix transcriptional regulator [Neobacillus cucumis]